MSGLAPDRGNHVTQPPPNFNDSLASFNSDLRDDSEHVSFWRRGIRSHDEVWSPEKIEMQGMIFRNECLVNELSNFLGCRGRLDAIKSIQCLGCGHVVRGRTDATYTRCDLRHVFRRTSLRKFFEASELRHLEVCFLHFPGGIQENLYFPVALQTGYRINSDTAPDAGCLFHGAGISGR